MTDHKVLDDSKHAENNKFILDVLNKVKSGKLSPELALISINSLIVTVDRDGRSEIRDIMNDAFGNALLNFSMEYLSSSEPSIIREFRKFLFDRATKPPSQEEIIAEMDEANQRIINGSGDKQSPNERVKHG